MFLHGPTRLTRPGSFWGRAARVPGVASLVTACAAIAMSAALPAGARADGPDDEPLLEDIPSVYGASKYDQRQTEAPSSVSVVTADEIARYGYRTLDDVLRSVRGLYVTSDLQYTYIGVRGTSRSGDYTGLVLVLVDGHRLNEPLFDQPALGRYFPVDVALIERVEVIRGPTSSLYGTNAFHAVVNVITKRGRDLDGVRLGMEAVSDGSWLARIAGGARVGEDFELSAGGAFYLAPGSALTLDGYGTFGGLDDEQAFDASLKLSWRQLTFMTALGTSRRGVPTGPYGSIVGSPRAWTDDLYYFAEARWADHWNGLDIEARMFLDHYYYHADFEYESGLESPLTVINHDRGNSDALGAQIQANVQVDDRLRLTFGMELKHAFSVGQGNHDLVVYLDDERTTTFGGLFAQGEWDPIAPLSLNVALRLDGYDTFGFELSPRAALIFEAGDETTFKLLAGRAFRAPNQYELHYGDGDGIKPAGELDPEHIESYELVWEQRLAAPLRAVLSGFRWHMSDLITFGEDPDDGRMTFSNRGTSSAWGLEAQLDAAWVDGPEAALSYSFVDARDGDGVWQRNSPRHQFKLQLAVPIVHRALVAGLTCVVTSPRKTKLGDETDWVPLVGLTLSSEDLVDGLTLALHADNLLDLRFADPASDDLAMPTLPQPGLRVGLSAAYRF